MQWGQSMNNPPEWLPGLISTDGEWDKVVSTLYAIFKSDFKEGKPTLKNSYVWWDRRVSEGEQYEEGFWHLISRDDYKTKERLFDPRRAERLPWCKATIVHYNDSAVLFWDNKISTNKITSYLWLKDNDYIVIFQKRKLRTGTVYFMKTAYYIDGDSKRRSLKRKYEKKEI